MDCDNFFNIDSRAYYFEPPELITLNLQYLQAAPTQHATTTDNATYYSNQLSSEASHHRLHITTSYY